VRRVIARGALLVVLATASLARADPIVVWPHGPTDDVTGIEAVVREAGHAPVAFAARDRLRAHGERAARAETEALAAVDAGLAAARAAYLRQDFAGMAAGLDQLERDALWLVAQPRHAPLLWELAFQRGLAAHAARDPQTAKRRFALALAIDEARTPRRELYGPDVMRAFAEAADARAAIAPRPAALRVAPPDARIAVDGLPIADPALPRNLRPGLHAIAASAPGHQPRAALLDLRAGDPIELALAAAGGNAIDRIDAAWATGALDPGTASGRRAIVDAATELGATAALVIEADPRTGETSARVITARDAPPPERRTTAVEAARAALARLGTAPLAVVDHTPPPPPVTRRWWFWGAIGAVVAAGAAGVVLAWPAEDRLRIHSP
jgi:hypothetical protein